MTTTMKVLVGGASAVLLAAVMFPVFATNKGSHRSPCLVNLKQCAAGLIIYLSDYDDRFPPAHSWMDAVKPIIKNEDLYSCLDIRDQGAKYGYAMNRFLDRAVNSKIQEPAKAHVLFESTLLKRNANEYLPSFPVPGRHSGVNYVAFADGHARGIKMAPAEK